MASMRDIKRRRTSIQSTQQITKAMKLVSTAKLQKARSRAEDSKAYFNCMYQTMTSLLAKAGNLNHALEHSNSPYILTLDADMIPKSDFLMKTIPYFVECCQEILAHTSWRMINWCQFVTLTA